MKKTMTAITLAALLGLGVLGAATAANANVKPNAQDQGVRTGGNDWIRQAFKPSKG